MSKTFLQIFCKCFILRETTSYLHHVFNVLKYLQKCFSIEHLQNILEVVTCKMKHTKHTQNIFANVLQMFYFTCNHSLTYFIYLSLSVSMCVCLCVCTCRCTIQHVLTVLSTRWHLTLNSCSLHLIQGFTALTSLCDC